MSPDRACIARVLVLTGLSTACEEVTEKPAECSHEHRLLAAMDLSPAALSSEDRVYLVAFDEKSRESRLLAIDENLEVTWQVPVPYTNAEPVLDADDNVVLLEEHGVLSIGSEGELRWTQAIVSPTGLAAARDGTLVVTTSEGVLRLDGDDGSTVAQRALQTSVQGRLVRVRSPRIGGDGRTYVILEVNDGSGSKQQLASLSAAMEFLWAVEVDRVQDGVAVGEQALVTVEGTELVVRERNGKVRVRVPAMRGLPVLTDAKSVAAAYGVFALEDGERLFDTGFSEHQMTALTEQSLLGGGTVRGAIVLGVSSARDAFEPLEEFPASEFRGAPVVTSRGCALAPMVREESNGAIRGCIGVAALGELRLSEETWARPHADNENSSAAPLGRGLRELADLRGYWARSANGLITALVFPVNAGTNNALVDTYQLYQYPERDAPRLAEVGTFEYAGERIVLSPEETFDDEPSRVRTLELIDGSNAYELHTTDPSSGKAVVFERVYDLPGAKRGDASVSWVQASGERTGVVAALSSDAKRGEVIDVVERPLGSEWLNDDRVVRFALSIRRYPLNEPSEVVEHDVDPGVARGRVVGAELQGNALIVYGDFEAGEPSGEHTSRFQVIRVPLNDSNELSTVSLFDPAPNPLVPQVVGASALPQGDLRVLAQGGSATIFVVDVGDDLSVRREVRFAPASEGVELSALALATDAQGNTFATVRVTGPVDFGNGVLPVPLDEAATTYLLHFDTELELAWARNLGPAYAPTRIAATDDAVTLAGELTGPLDVGLGEEALSAAETTGADLLLLRFDATGQPVWQRRVDGPFPPAALGDVATDEVGTTAIAGNLGGVFGDLNTGQIWAAGSELVIATFDVCGRARWGVEYVREGGRSWLPALEVRDLVPLYDGSWLTAGLVTAPLRFGATAVALNVLAEGTAGAGPPPEYPLALLVNGAARPPATGPCAATPALPLTLELAIEGAPGRVTAEVIGLDCADRCSSQVDAGTVVTVTAVPEESTHFVGFDGPCEGQGALCTFALDQDLLLTARFDANRVAAKLTVDGLDSTPQTRLAPANDGGVYALVSISQPVKVGAQELTPRGENDLAVIKLSAAGQVEWTTTIGTIGSDGVVGLANAGNGIVVLASTTEEALWVADVELLGERQTGFRFLDAVALGSNGTLVGATRLPATATSARIATTNGGHVWIQLDYRLETAFQELTLLRGELVLELDDAANLVSAAVWPYPPTDALASLGNGLVAIGKFSTPLELGGNQLLEPLGDESLWLLQLGESLTYQAARTLRSSARPGRVWLASNGSDRVAVSLQTAADLETTLDPKPAGRALVVFDRGLREIWGVDVGRDGPVAVDDEGGAAVFVAGSEREPPRLQRHGSEGELSWELEWQASSNFDMHVLTTTPDDATWAAGTFSGTLDLAASSLGTDTQATFFVRFVP